jgi:hypothetical protein
MGAHVLPSLAVENTVNSKPERKVNSMSTVNTLCTKREAWRKCRSLIEIDVTNDVCGRETLIVNFSLSTA